MPASWRSLAFGVLVLVPALARADKPSVEYKDDRLTAHLSKVPAPECVRALETATGATIRGKVPPDGEVSIDLEAVPLHQALGRLFGESNFSITYASDGRPAAIELLGGPLPAAVAQPAAPTAVPVARSTDQATWLSDPTTEKAVGTLTSFLERNQSVDLPAGLAKSLGARSMPFHDLVKAAATNDDRAVRARSWQLSLRTMREDPDVWSAFKTVVATAPGDSMRDFARHLLGPHAEELTRQLVARADPDMRAPMRDMLHGLEAQPRPVSESAATH